MNIFKRIKESLGDRARDIILSDLGREHKNGLFKCMYPDHQDSNPSSEWKGDAFHCYSCANRQYDIFTHYEYKGKTINEALKELARMTNIHLDSSYISPSNDIKVKRILDVSKYNPMTANRTLDQDFIDFLGDRGIDPSVARSYGVLASQNNQEILFRHCELVNGKWAEVLCKRRKLDKTPYEINGNEVKEISVRDGVQCLFAVNTIFTKSGAKPFCIITEGHIDALRLATAIKECGMASEYAVLSIPNGANTLKTALENSPTFMDYYRSEANACTIIIPDADDAGLAFIENAKKVMDHGKAKFIDIAELKGINHQATKGLDISDVLDLYKFEDVIALQQHFPIEGCDDVGDIQQEFIETGVWTGFATWDYNDSGLKKGGVTLLTGYRGQGKTTLARQVVMNVAKQDYQSFCYFGESKVNHEISKFARMCANDGEIISKDNGAGRTVFYPNEDAVDRFKQEHGTHITLYSPPEKTTAFFDDCLAKIELHAQRGYFLFLVDNMMMLTSGAQNVFAEQARIAKGLKEFAKKYDAHVILIAHPKKGEGQQSVSGAAEQENMVDTIIRYIRPPSNIKADYCEEDRQCVSAMVEFEKARDEGTDYNMYLEWEHTKGVVSDLTYIEDAKETAERYADLGWYSRATISSSKDFRNGMVEDIVNSMSTNSGFKKLIKGA